MPLDLPPVPPAVVRPEAASRTVVVRDDATLAVALREVRAGADIRIAPGTYRGGVNARKLRGTADAPITLRALDPDRPPVFDHGGRGGSVMQFSGVTHLHVRGLVLRNCLGNGLNIDDGGAENPPSTDVRIVGVRVENLGPGNNDGIKLSGVDRVRVEGCTLTDWGNAGSGVDFVGCHDATVTGCTFTGRGDTVLGNGVQAKGGSRGVVIRGNRFNHAHVRAVQIGGSTGLTFFRPAADTIAFEAKDITVEDNVIVGSEAAVAFVSCDGATVRRNTIVRPTKWVFRILQEQNHEGFVPTRGGIVERNLILFAGDPQRAINVGTGTAPETFVFRDNWWFHPDAPARSRPTLPVAETGGVYGVDPGLTDPTGPRPPAGPAAGYGAEG